MRNNGNDLWIQFKLERLLDFFYKCGLLSHVTGKCNIKDPTLVTTSNGTSTKLFGPWLRAENGGSMQFINTSEHEDQCQADTEMELESDELARITMEDKPALIEAPEEQTSP